MPIPDRPQQVNEPSKPAPAEPPDTDTEQSVAGAALLAGASGLIHASVIVQHFQESTPFGVFFVAAAVFQLGWATTILTWARWRLLVAGAAGNVVIAFVWVASRTVGLPVGPEPWTSEAVSLPDLLATMYEVTVAALVATLRDRRLPGGEVLLRHLRPGARLLTLLLATITVVAILEGH